MTLAGPLLCNPLRSTLQDSPNDRDVDGGQAAPDGHHEDTPPGQRRFSELAAVFDSLTQRVQAVGAHAFFALDEPGRAGRSQLEWLALQVGHRRSAMHQVMLLLLLPSVAPHHLLFDVGATGRTPCSPPAALELQAWNAGQRAGAAGALQQAAVLLGVCGELHSALPGPTSVSLGRQKASRHSAAPGFQRPVLHGLWCQPAKQLNPCCRFLLCRWPSFWQQPPAVRYTSSRLQRPQPRSSTQPRQATPQLPPPRRPPLPPASP